MTRDSRRQPGAPTVEALQRFTEWARREQSSLWAMVLVVVHTGVPALYLTGSAVSPVPFTRDDVQTVIRSPFLPVSHLATAVLLALAVTSPRLRDLAAPVSLGLWLGTAAALYFAAASRVPPLAMWGPAFALGWMIAAGVLTLVWPREDDHEVR